MWFLKGWVVSFIIKEIFYCKSGSKFLWECQGSKNVSTLGIQKNVTETLLEWYLNMVLRLLGMYFQNIFINMKSSI